MKNTLFVYPEGILAGLYLNDLKNYQYLIDESFSEKHKIILGVNSLEDGKVFNTLVFFDNKLNILHKYKKNKLVPFGEYTPWYDIFLFISNYINFPLSNITPGRENQDSIFFNGTHIIPVICFESNFPNLVESIQTDEIIVNISNDGWFGDSFSQHQHLQINKIRALEFNRYLLRSTNTGISAVITNKGKVLKSIENNERGTISGIALAGFNTSIYSRHGDLAILMLIFFTIFLKLIGINNKHE